MHIVFLSDNFPPETNALASRTFEHAQRWVQAGHEVTVITTVPNSPEGKVHQGFKNRWRSVEDMQGIKVIRVWSYITANEGFVRRILDYTSYMLVAIIQGLWVKKPDVIVGSSPQFFNAVGAWILAKLRRKPFVFELRDIWPASISAVAAMPKKGRVMRMLEALEVRMYRDATRIVAVTESFKRYLVAKNMTKSKIDVVLNGVDLTRFQPLPEKDPGLLLQYALKDKFIIGYIGTHGMAHDLANVVRAAVLLRAQEHIHFLFVGAGAEKQQIQELAQEQELNNITFVTRQPKDRMPAYWSLCDLALIHLKDTPLFADVIPSKIFEAMGMGKAILHVQPEGEATHITTQAGAAQVVVPNNPEALARAISALADDPEHMAKLHLASAQAAPQFSREQGAAQMLKALQKAVEIHH